jgi:hypothetical protein
MNGPKVSVVLSGFVIVTVIPLNDSVAFCDAAEIPKWIKTVWPTPTGLGLAPMKA